MQTHPGYLKAISDAISSADLDMRNPRGPAPWQPLRDANRSPRETRVKISTINRKKLLMKVEARGAPAVDGRGVDPH